MKFTILTIDDEENIRNGLADNFELEGYEVKQAASGKEGLQLIEKGDIDLVITDLRMDGISGQEVVNQVTSKYPGLPIIVLTGHGSIEDATSAIKMGAYDFLTKPLDLTHLNKIVKNALQGRELALQKTQLLKELNNFKTLDKMVGKSAELRKVSETISKVAPSKATVLITGESGVGKELVADAIHNLSNRKDKPFVKVHCAALSESLLESELFGHEKGSFTGADTMQKGRFELAHGGTIFLDEIGEINQSIQVKILRVLQEKKFERVGGEKTIDVDVRIVAATNKNLEEEVKAGRFREDLYYRLNVVRIQMPSLRERKDDIPLLVKSFLREFNLENEKNVTGFDAKSKAAILKYNWPGNIRELRNCVECAVVMCNGEEITLEDLPVSVRESVEDKNIIIPHGITLDEAEKIIIQNSLTIAGGNKTKAAQILGIGRKTLHRKLQEYGMESESTEEIED
ncbi:MAG: sigma-54-dependent Fis family transcriptional regulator [Treponema bryantii]|nr:sigma-54-dependent Fis family transcriptional regulator [Treponema bryantii]